MNDVYVLDIVARITSTKKRSKTKVHFLSDHVVGPGVQAAFKANVCLWVFYSIYPFLAYHAFPKHWWECRSDTFANYTIEVMGLYVPILLAVMYYEYKAMIYALPPQVAIIGPFGSTFHGLLPQCVNSFIVWFLFASSMSLVAHLDLATNSLFLSKVLATQRCHDMRKIDEIWDVVFSKSLFLTLASIMPSFSNVVTLLWLLLFGQFVYGVAGSVPLKTSLDGECSLSGVWSLLGLGNEDLYEVKDRDLGGGKKFGFKTYSTLLHQRTQHGNALAALAESGRMYGIRFNLWSLQQKLVQLRLYKSGQVYREVKKTLGFFVVFMWFESIVQLELQGSALELGKAMSPEHHLDYEMVLSLTLSVLMASYNHCIVCVKFYRQTQACLAADEEDENAESTAYNKKVKVYCRRLRPIFAVVALAFAVCLVHAITKLFMVSFYCECGWNVRWNPMDGCVTKLTDGTGVTCAGIPS